MRRNPINASDIQKIGGSVATISGRDRESSPFFQIEFVSGGGDIVWRSCRIVDEDRAEAGAMVLADFLGAKRG